MKRFAKGEFAITVNSRAPLVNDGHLVIVREVLGPVPDEGLDFAYVIERVDGEPFALTCQPGTPMPRRGGRLVRAGEHHLRRLGGPARGRSRRTAHRREAAARQPASVAARA